MVNNNLMRNCSILSSDQVISHAHRNPRFIVCSYPVSGDALYASQEDKLSGWDASSLPESFFIICSLCGWLQSEISHLEGTVIVLVYIAKGR